MIVDSCYFVVAIGGGGGDGGSSGGSGVCVCLSVCMCGYFSFSWISGVVLFISYVFSLV